MKKDKFEQIIHNLFKDLGLILSNDYELRIHKIHDDVYKLSLYKDSVDEYSVKNEQLMDGFKELNKYKRLLK